MTVEIDPAWLDDHPLPVHGENTDKNSRGRVLLVGGAEFVPGALRLTGEAALRAGAGKVQMATVGAIATALGVLVPEAAMIALPADADGEIALAAADRLIEAMARCDTLIIGPGMSEAGQTAALLKRLLDSPAPPLSILLDAAAITGARDLEVEIARHEGRVVMTPHHGEMASLTGAALDAFRDDPGVLAAETAARFKATIVLKASETLVVPPAGPMLHYGGDCVGLATGGSGDVLAGIIGGLMSRGASPETATGWGVWLHGEAGLLCAERLGPLGFLARDLLAEIPRLMARVA